MTIPLSLEGLLFPIGSMSGAGLTASGAILSINASLSLEGEVTNITVGADNPKGMIAPFGTLTHQSDAAPITLTGEILPTGVVVTQAVDSGCFDTPYECIDSTPTDFSCIGACEVQEPIVIPEMLLQGVIIPIGALVQVPQPTQLLEGMITPVGTLATLKSGFPLDNLMIWLKSYVETPQTDGGSPINRFVAGSDWIDQAKPEENADTFFNGGAVLPALIPAIDGVNGHPIVRFDDASGFRFFAGHTGMSEGHLFMALKMAHGVSAGSESGFMSMGCTQPSHYPWADGIAYFNYATTVRKTTPYQASWGITNWHIVEFRSKAGHWSFRINGGSPIISTSVNTFCIPTGGDGAYIGGFPGIKATYDLCEFMEFNKVLTDGEATEIVNYLKGVIGIP